MVSLYFAGKIYGLKNLIHCVGRQDVRRADKVVTVDTSELTLEFGLLYLPYHIQNNSEGVISSDYSFYKVPHWL
jgi:hypothetical protein